MLSLIAPVFSVIFPLYQSRNHHQQNIDQANVHHLDSIEIENRHHDASMILDRELARRESLRDTLQQRLSKSSTLMINITLMFGFGFAILIEGMPPENTSNEMFIIFTIFLGISFFCLFISLWLIINMQSLMGKYNIHNPNQLYQCKNGIRKHDTFNDYYQCHCKWIAKLSQKLFYSGAISLMITGTILFCIRVHTIHQIHSPIIIFTIIISLIPIIIVIFHLYFGFNNKVRVPSNVDNTLINDT